jgi:hypothetical protein
LFYIFLGCFYCSNRNLKAWGGERIALLPCHWVILLSKWWATKRVWRRRGCLANQ